MSAPWPKTALGQFACQVSKRPKAGTVHVLDLEGHPKAAEAYAWSSPIEGSHKGRFYAVFHLGGIRSPLDAMRAAIVVEKRTASGKESP
jgi:hypothetical protein